VDLTTDPSYRSIHTQTTYGYHTRTYANRLRSMKPVLHNHRKNDCFYERKTNQRRTMNDDMEAADPLTELRNTWHNFKTALCSVEPFDQWAWIRVLLKAVINYLFSIAKQMLPFLKKWKMYRQLVPCFAIFLVSSLLSTYFLVLRSEVVVRRWCNTEVNDSIKKGSFPCRWVYVHDAVVTYFGLMILFNYFITVFSSPGVALPSTVAIKQLEKHNIADPEYVWKSRDSRGGCCFIDPFPVNIEREFSRVEHCTPKKTCLQGFRIEGLQNHGQNKVKTIYFPSLELSNCDKCQIARPPRCRHCSACNRCVLQMDHHCLWMNNCIAYANYRSFLLTLIFILLACLYGTLMLISPFKELLHEQIARQGFWASLWSIRVPPLWILVRQSVFSCYTRGLNDFIAGEIAIKIAFPFLLGVSITMIVFIISHLRLIAQGISTLERIIQLDKMKSVFLSSSDDKDNVLFVNPFDQGFYKNLCQVFGPNFLLALLPVRVEPPHPYFPDHLREFKKKC